MDFSWVLFFISENTGYFYTTFLFILLLGFIYGYAISFIFGAHKTLKLSFFLVIIANILILLMTTIYLITSTCFGKSGNPCTNTSFFFSALPLFLSSLVFSLFTNIIAGYMSVFLGILFYLPSEFIKNKLFPSSSKTAVTPNTNEQKVLTNASPSEVLAEYNARHEKEVI